MSDAQIQDLKQFIYATVSQATANKVTKDDIVALDARLSGQINDVDHKLNVIAETLNEDLRDHEQRITKLERIG